MTALSISKKKENTGFSLVELMVTLSIAAIVLSFAAPSFSTTIQNNRLTTETNNLISSLTLARSEAIKRRTNITMCSSNDQATCTNTAWQYGWIVVDAAGNVLRVFDGMKGSTTVASAADNLTYTPVGFLNGGAATLGLCAESGKPGRGIAITATGRPSNVYPYPTC